jgi:HD-GYP domain-containing protein (c-di-GMP phosphodiesterase class II)
LRTARLAVEIGRELGLLSSELEVVRGGAFWHDVGKLALPRSLWSQPGPLSADQWRLVRTHPETGAFLAGAAGLGEDVRQIVFMHHERLDGSGYPRGTRDVSLLVRVVAAADVWDAMTPPRAYAEPLPYDAAVRETLGETGRLGADVVATLLEVALARKEEDAA